MEKSILNFYKCIEAHPQFVYNGRIFVASTKRYESLAEDICHQFREFNSQLQVIHYNLHIDNIIQIKEGIRTCDMFILFYDNDYTQAFGRSIIIQQLSAEFKQYWKKSCMLRNYGNYFDEAFGVHPEQLKVIADKLIEIATQCDKLIYNDNFGSNLEVKLNNDTKWTSICGCDTFDLVPGEIATLGEVNGVVTFTGTFLSVIPFAAKYGIIYDPLILTIKNNIITDFKSDNSRLVKDLHSYFQYNTANTKIGEVGIGINHAVNLHGINAGFEERHVGLHLGLGGTAHGSDHLDLIFQSGSLCFDNIKVIDNETII